MQSVNANFVGVLVYKIVTLLVGLAFAWMGYRLFALGMTRQSGNLEVQAGKGLSLKLTRAAPGIFFAVLGAAIVIYSVTRILQITQSNPGPGAAARTDGSTAIVSGESGGGGVPPSPPATPPVPAPPPDHGTVTICDTCAAPTPPAPPPAGGSTTTICDTCPAPARPPAAVRAPVSPRNKPAAAAAAHKVPQR